jgi:hypothetical protein
MSGLADSAVLDAVLDSPWERMRRRAAEDIGGVAVEALSMSLNDGAACVDELAGAPILAPDEISEAFDDIVEPRTVRVCTDLTWSLEGH